MGKTLMIIILSIRLDGVGFLLRHEKVFQTANVPTCNSIFYSANSPSKQQGGRHIVIGAMGSVDRVFTLGGVGGGRKPQTGIIYIYI